MNKQQAQYVLKLSVKQITRTNKSRPYSSIQNWNKQNRL